MRDGTAHPPLRIEFAVGVWGQLKDFTQTEADQLHQELGRLAKELSQNEVIGHRSAVLAGVQVDFEVSRARQVLTVVRVSRLPTQPKG